MDQCKRCECRGDLAKCESVDCTYHELWYVQELKAAILRLGGPLIKSPNMVCFTEIKPLGVNTRVVLSNGLSHVLCGKAQDPLPTFVARGTFDYEEFKKAVNAAIK